MNSLLNALKARQTIPAVSLKKREPSIKYTKKQIKFSIENWRAQK